MTVIVALIGLTINGILGQYVWWWTASWMLWGGLVTGLFSKAVAEFILGEF